MALNADQLAELRQTISEYHASKDDDKARRIFQLFDINGDGTLDKEEMQTIMGQVKGEVISDEEATKMIDQADTNHDGVVDLNEFIEFMKTR